MSMPSRNKRKERSSPEPQTQPPSEIPASSSSSLATDNLSSPSMTPEPQTQPPSEIPASSSSAADNLSSPSRKPHLLYLPPGYKFVPDEQEILRYLKAYLDGYINSLLYVPIHHVNIYESNPEQLSVEFKKGNETEWFFITERNKVAAKNGKKHKRGDNGGFWHATTKTTSIDAGVGVVGNETALAYYVGKPSNGVKTKWLMHEFWFDSSTDDNENENVVKKDYALCKMYVRPQVLKKEKAEEEEKQKRRKEEEALVEQQPSNVEYHQSLVDSYQPEQSQSSQSLVDSYQSDQLQFSQPLVNSHQPYQSQSSKALMGFYQPDQSQFSQSLVDSYQLQPRDFAYQEQRQFWSDLLGSYQEQQSTMILHPPPQGQDSRYEMVMTMQSNPDWSDIYNDFDIDEYLRMDQNMIRQKR